MPNELQRNQCLELIHSIIYHSNGNLLTSGRYIKALRHVYSHLESDNDKTKYTYLINRYLQKHLIYLQEAIINSYNNDNKQKKIPINTGKFIKFLAKSHYAIKDDKYSLVDVEELKKLEMIKKSVNLSKDLVLPCKVKSKDEKYKFNVEIIVTKRNVLTYATYDLDYDYDPINRYHNILLVKQGKGLKDFQYKQKNNQHQNRRPL